MPSRTPAACVAATSASARAVVISIGFSSRMCLPAAAREIEMGIGRRQDQHSLDRAIRQDGFEPLTEWKIEVAAEGFPPCRRRTVGVDDLDAVRQIAERPGVRGDGHAETDQGDALL
jgi:hypothetical protein